MGFNSGFKGLTPATFESYSEPSERKSKQYLREGWGADVGKPYTNYWGPALVKDPIMLHVYLSFSLVPVYKDI